MIKHWVKQPIGPSAGYSMWTTFMIWTSSPEKLDVFLVHLKWHQNIYFAMETEIYGSLSFSDT